MTIPLHAPKRKVPGVFPHEHGAYVTLLTPLGSALFFAPSLRALVWALVAFALFVAHEPLSLLLGRRGERRRELGRGVAWRALALLAAFALPASAALIVSMDPLARRALLVPALACTAAGMMLAAEREKTVIGELVATTALVALCLPALALSSVPYARAAHFALAWLVVHGLAMLTARAYVYRKRQGRGLLHLVSALAAAIPLGALAAYDAGWLALSLCIAPCMVALVTLGLLTGLFEPGSPKQLGWALAGAMLPAVALIGLALG